MMAIAIGVPVLLAAIYFMFLAGPSKAKFLNKQRQKITLSERINLSPDTVRFRFNLPKSTPVLGLPVGKHFKLYCPNPVGKTKGDWNGREDMEADETEIERKYTPTTSDSDVGFVDLVIKVYKGGVVDRFPDGGKMSQYMDTLKVGDTLDIMGPIGTHEYLGKGKFKSSSKEHTCKKVGMMAGGTGITPMLQVMAAILKDPSDPTQISLLYANQTEEDILCRDLLEELQVGGAPPPCLLLLPTMPPRMLLCIHITCLPTSPRHLPISPPSTAFAHRSSSLLQAKHPNRLSIHYTLDRPPKGWKYSEGFITDTMIAEHLPVRVAHSPPRPHTRARACAANCAWHGCS